MGTFTMIMLGSPTVNQQAAKSLAEFNDFLGNPDIYPDISTTLIVMSLVLRLFALFLGMVGFIIVLLIVGQTAIDVLCIFLQGFADQSANNGKGNAISKMIKFTSYKSTVPPNVWSYMKSCIVSNILSLSFAILLITNQMLPFVGRITTVLGSGVQAVTTVNFDLTSKEKKTLDSKVAASDALDRAVNSKNSGKSDPSLWADAHTKISSMDDGNEKNSYISRYTAESGKTF